MSLTNAAFSKLEHILEQNFMQLLTKFLGLNFISNLLATYS